MRILNLVTSGVERINCFDKEWLFKHLTVCFAEHEYRHRSSIQCYLLYDSSWHAFMLQGAVMSVVEDFDRKDTFQMDSVGRWNRFPRSSALGTAFPSAICPGTRSSCRSGVGQRSWSTAVSMVSFATKKSDWCVTTEKWGSTMWELWRAAPAGSTCDRHLRLCSHSIDRISCHLQQQMPLLWLLLMLTLHHPENTINSDIMARNDRSQRRTHEWTAVPEWLSCATYTTSCLCVYMC